MSFATLTGHFTNLPRLEGEKARGKNKSKRTAKEKEEKRLQIWQSFGKIIFIKGFYCVHHLYNLVVCYNIYVN